MPFANPITVTIRLNQQYVDYWQWNNIAGEPYSPPTFTTTGNPGTHPYLAKGAYPALQLTCPSNVGGSSMAATFIPLPLPSPRTTVWNGLTWTQAFYMPSANAGASGAVGCETLIVCSSTSPSGFGWRVSNFGALGAGFGIILQNGNTTGGVLSGVAYNTWHTQVLDMDKFGNLTCTIDGVAVPSLAAGPSVPDSALQVTYIVSAGQGFLGNTYWGVSRIDWTP